jgi:hypothetical protein
MNKVIIFLRKQQCALIITILSILAYGLFIPWLGYYIDDWMVNWVYITHGTQGMIEYFSVDQPLLGLIYRATMPFLHGNILLGQLFGLFWKILCSLTFYWLMTILWPGRKHLTFTAGLLFSVYPGFLLQPLALTMSYTWLVYTIFFLSNCFTVLAIQSTTKRNVFTIFALILSLFNILLLEYFIPLEVTRFGILFYLNSKTGIGYIKKLVMTIKLWLPYLAVLLLGTLSRFFFFKYQTAIYPLGLVDLFNESILSGIIRLISEAISALYQSVIFAWINPFLEIIKRFSLGKTYILTSIIMITTFLCLLLIFRRLLTITNKSRDNSPLYISFLSLLVAGIPFYVTLLQVDVIDISSRFTIPFMLGASLLIAFLLENIPYLWIKILLLNIILTASVGLHVLNANDYRLISLENNKLMYEIFWRAPNLKPNTLIVINEQKNSKFFTSSTITAEFNLVYPHKQNNMFGVIYPRDLLDKFPLISSDDEVINLSGIYQGYVGTTDNIVVFQKSDNGCLQFVDKDSIFINSDIRENSLQNLSDPDNLIDKNSNNLSLNKDIVGPEPLHEWCYYFEKTELALQQNDFVLILENYNIVQNQNLKPHYGYEWFPFIEGLARGGDWQAAFELSEKVIEQNITNESYQYSICQKLNRIIIETNNPDKTKTITDKLNCKL